MIKSALSHDRMKGKLDSATIWTSANGKRSCIEVITTVRRVCVWTRHSLTVGGEQRSNHRLTL